MFELVTKNQLRIATEASGFFRHFLPGLSMPNAVTHVFRQDDDGLNVALLTEDEAHSFVVRETINPGATVADICEVCERLIRALIHSHHIVQLSILKEFR